MKLTVNNREVAIDADPAMPLLWALREFIGLTGTKFGCGAAQCGACTVHLDDQAIRSCITPISEAEGKKLTTIEAATDGSDRVGAAVHAAWLKHDVAQCGYCQPGQIMTAVAKVRQARAEGRDLGDADFDEIRNICRCGTYSRIRAAITAGAKNM